MSTHPTTHGVVVDFGEPPQRRTPASNELARKIIDDAREAYDRADRDGEFILPIPYQNHDVTTSQLANSLHTLCNQQSREPFQFVSIYPSGSEVVFYRH